MRRASRHVAWFAAWLGLIALAVAGFVLLPNGYPIAGGVALLGAMTLSAVLTHAAHVAADRPTPPNICESCGYALAGLQPAKGGKRRCPECGVVDTRARSAGSARGVNQPVE